MRYSLAEDRDDVFILEQDAAFTPTVIAQARTWMDATAITEALKYVERIRGVNVITICGSMRFFEQMLEEAERHTIAGAIVLMPFVTPHDGFNPDVKERLDELHLRKIDISDAIQVVNPGGYIGESTRREITYAQEKDKHVFSTVPLGQYLDD